MPESLAPAAPLRKVPRAVEKSQDPERLQRMRVAKEGSRRGKEISANARACGTALFCTAVAEPQGDFGLLEQSLAAVSAESPEKYSLW